MGLSFWLSSAAARIASPCGAVLWLFPSAPTPGRPPDILESGGLRANGRRAAVAHSTLYTLTRYKLSQPSFALSEEKRRRRRRRGPYGGQGIGRG